MIRQRLRLLGRLLNHPTDTYWELKHTRRWDLAGSVVILLIWFLATVFSQQLTDFKFNYRNTAQFNVLYVAAATFGLFILWTVVNWAVAALLDGKGTMREIWVSSAYALVPYIGSLLIGTALSHLLTVDETVFISLVSVVGALWSGFLLIDALHVVHDYSVGKTVGSMLIVLAGMLFVLFLGVLFFGLVQQVVLFFKTIYVELRLRR